MPFGRGPLCHLDRIRYAIWTGSAMPFAYSYRPDLDPAYKPHFEPPSPPFWSCHTILRPQSTRHQPIEVQCVAIHQRSVACIHFWPKRNFLKKKHEYYTKNRQATQPNSVILLYFTPLFYYVSLRIFAVFRSAIHMQRTLLHSPQENKEFTNNSTTTLSPIGLFQK